MSRLLSQSRYIVLIPSISSLVGALMLMLYGAQQTVVQTFHAISGMLYGQEKGLKKESIAFLEIVDVFLLATVLYIIGIGLYELFIDEVELPQWLIITTLDDLKEKMIGVVVTVMAVLFLQEVVSWDHETNLLPFGAAIALVVAALTMFLAQSGKKKTAHKAPTISQADSDSS